MKLPRTYLIPGLGADHRLFKGLQEQGMDFEVLEFMPPMEKETLADYGKRMSERIDTSEPFVLGGVSLGGMISMEVCKHVHPEQILLISSVKTAREFPFYFQLFRYMPIHRALPPNWLKTLAPRNPFRMASEKRDVLENMRQEMDAEFVKWAINAAICWRNKEIPKNLIHIHGTRDLMFPPFLLGEHTKLSKGSHVMVLNRAAEVRHLLMTELRNELG